MPSLAWICERVRRARAMTVVIGDRMPAALRTAVLDAYQRGAALAVWTARGYDVDAVSAFLDVSIPMKHADVQSSGVVLIDRRDGWFIPSGLSVDRPEHAGRILERTQVAEWVRFRGRVDQIDAAGEWFTVADLSHVTLRGLLPAAVAVPGAFVQVTALRSTFVGQEAYRPHDLFVVAVKPRASDGVTRRLDEAIAASGSVPAVVRPGLRHLLAARGFANLVDVGTYLQDHGVSGTSVAAWAGACMPGADSDLVPAVWAMIAMALQARTSELHGTLSAFAPALGTLTETGHQVGGDARADRLLAVTETLVAEVGAVLGVLSATVDTSLLRLLRRLTRDLQALRGHPVTVRVGTPGAGDAADIKILRVGMRAVGSSPTEFSKMGAGVILVVDAAPWTLEAATALRHVPASGQSRVQLVGLDGGAAPHVDLCVGGSARSRDETLRGTGLHAGNLEMVTLLVHAVRIVHAARSRPHGASPPVKAGTSGIG
ncbi:MAG TPA: hypothetical protein VEP50_06320 [bacterium]|nr:hypothetical protein [bacterium]